MWVTATNLPTAASHPFYRRLNQLLREHSFDAFVEAQCAGFYAATTGRPSLRPRIYFRTAADWLLRRQCLSGNSNSFHATRIYADYWTCNWVIFLSREQIVYEVLNDELGTGKNRYPA